MAPHIPCPPDTFCDRYAIHKRGRQSKPLLCARQTKKESLETRSRGKAWESARAFFPYIFSENKIINLFFRHQQENKSSEPLLFPGEQRAIIKTEEPLFVSKGQKDAFILLIRFAAKTKPDSLFS